MANRLGKLAPQRPAPASLRDFVSMLSHELRSTLAATQMWTEVLRSPAIDEATRQRALDGIGSCVKLQAALIDHMTDGARATSDGFEMVGVSTDCSVIVAEAIAAERAPAAAKEIALVTDIATVGGVVEDARPIAAEPDGLSPWSLSGLTVVVVEDDEEARDGLACVLRLRGVRIVTTSSAAEGLRALVELRPDVLLCELTMPGTDGYAFIRQVRALDPCYGGTVPAAALTAENRDSHRRAALDAGFDRYVAKPFDFDTLTGVLFELSRLR
jgi:CheY-like chemotaxis protein